MQPDMATVRETGSLVKAIWPWVKRTFDFRKRLEQKIDVDVAAGSDAVRVDVSSPTCAIAVRLKVSNFSPLFSVRLRRATGNVTMRGETYTQVVSRESVTLFDKVPRGQPTFVECPFKLNDSQVRSLREFSQYPNLEVGLNIEVEMSSLFGTIHSSRPGTPILIKSWRYPADM